MARKHFNLGDRVRFVDRCQVLRGVVTDCSGELMVEVEYVNSSGGKRQEWAIVDRVFQHDDVAGVCTYLRERAKWMLDQADRIEREPLE